MLFAEGSYYFMCVLGMLFTVGVAALVGVKIYMENKLSYLEKMCMGNRKAELLRI